MLGAYAVALGLLHRARTGEGQHIDMALLDAQVAMLANLGANYLVNPPSAPVPGRMGNAHVNIVPYQVCAVADGHVMLAVGNHAPTVSLYFVPYLVWVAIASLLNWKIVVLNRPFGRARADGPDPSGSSTDD